MIIATISRGVFFFFL
uniref:Uncharacterized protein n=1 Tax=Rhizophora mucronata TaxID=61149 RepID=A0A2P2N2F8_RHIMU